MPRVILSLSVGLVCLLILQLPIYRWFDEKIISRRESPPRSEFGLVPIQLLPGFDDSGAFKGPYGLDIIFVHGLGSNPDTTWLGKTDASDIDWITSLLPHDLQPNLLPDTRLFHYNYDSYWFRDALEVRLEDLSSKLLIDIYSMNRNVPETAHRRTVFIAYSYGGLVVKQALIQAKREAKFSLVADSVSGIIFLGTPHNGTDLSRVAWFAAMSLRIFGSNPYILDGLQHGSQLVQSMHLNFMHYYQGKITAVNFFEERKTRLLKMGFIQWEEYVVRKDSATYEAQDIVNIGLAVDHKGLNKFSSRSSIYRQIVSQLNQFIKADFDAHRGSCFKTIPKFQAPEYVNRPKISKLIENEIQIFNALDSTAHCLILSGLGGCGKTQLALKYIESHGNNYSHIFWVDASSTSAVMRSYRTFAEEIGLQEDQLRDSSEIGPTVIIEIVTKWLEGLIGFQSHWLMVIDELDDLNVEPSNLIPRGKRGTVLITSRRNFRASTINRYLPKSCKAVQVDSLEQEEAVELLVSVSSHSRKTAPQHILEAASEIAQLLHYHPLALGLSYASASQIALMESPEQSLSLYLQDLKNHRETMLGDPQYAVLTSYEKTVQTAWDTSLSAIESQNINSTKLLALLSYFHHEEIPFDFFRFASAKFHSNSQPFNAMYKELPPWCQDLLSQTPDGNWDSFQFRRIMQPLISYSMVQTFPSPVGTAFRIHGLVQWRARQMSDGVRTLLSSIYIMSAAAAVIEKGTLNRHMRYLTPHLQQLNKTKHVEQNSLEETEFFQYHSMTSYITGLIFHHEGLLDEAQAAYIEAGMVHLHNVVSSNRNGSYGPGFFSTVLSVANAKQDKGNWTSSEQMLNFSLTTLGFLLPDNEAKRNQLEFLFHLAINYRLQGRLEKAEQTLHQVYHETLELYGNDNKKLVPVLEQMAYLHIEQGKWQDGQDPFQQMGESMLDHRINRDGAGIVLKTNKINLLNRQRRFSEAEELTKTTLVESIEIFGEMHEISWDLKAHLADVYAATRQCSDAVPLMEAVMSFRQNFYGKDSSKVLMSATNLGAAYGLCGQKTKGIKQLKKTIKAAYEHVSDDHPLVLRAKGHLAEIFREQGDWKRAEKIQLQIVNQSIHSLGKEHPETLRRMAALGMIYSAQKQPEQAEKYITMAMDNGLRSFKENSELYSHLIDILIVGDSQRSKAGGALQRLIPLAAIQLQEHGPSDEKTLDTSARIAAIYLERDDFKSAEPILLQIEKHGLEYLGEGHRLTLFATEAIATIYRLQRRWESAYLRFRYLTSVYLKQHGEEDGRTLRVMADAGWTAFKMNAWDDAAYLLETTLEIKSRMKRYKKPDTLVMLDLGAVYKMQGRSQEAFDMLMEVVHAAMVSHDKNARNHADSAIFYLRSIMKEMGKEEELRLLENYLPDEQTRESQLKEYIALTKKRDGVVDDLEMESLSDVVFRVLQAMQDADGATTSLARNP
ncbi:hypothetical protein B0O99DRAFT_741175 [Bisporella sp. PMI_857]|nr:hypothetical protein B0O99DRAFT_741175 [Bisporella sp. PMI_857]